MIEVEVPENGTVVVQDGDVNDVKEYPPKQVKCYCTDGVHWNRRAGVEPHDIFVQQFELAWEVKE